MTANIQYPVPTAAGASANVQGNCRDADFPSYPLLSLATSATKSLSGHLARRADVAIPCYPFGWAYERNDED